MHVQGNGAAGKDRYTNLPPSYGLDDCLNFSSLRMRRILEILMIWLQPSQQRESAQPKGPHPLPVYPSGARCGELLVVKRRAEKDPRLVVVRTT